MRTPEYHPFPLGSGNWNLQWGVRRRLYYCDTHLLLVENLGFSEVYSRIYYKDIRYMVIVPTYVQEILGGVQGLLLLGCLGLFLAVLQFQYFSVFPAALGIIVLIFFIMNLSDGASCSCYLGTQAQSIRIPMPNRYRQIPRLIEFLKSCGVQEALLR